jgi:hypothetical protein
LRFVGIVVVVRVPFIILAPSLFEELLCERR